MDFTFSEDQLLFRDTVRDFLVNEITPERIRASWAAGSFDEPLWQQLTEMGLVGLSCPEAAGGLDMDAVDFVLLAEQCGYVALHQPLVTTVLLAVPALQSIGGELAAQWLPRIAAGEARVAVGLAQNLLVEDADSAALLLLERDGAWYAEPREHCTLRLNESVDPSRRLFAVELPAGAQAIASGAQARALTDLLLDAGALGAAAQALGLAQRMVDLSVAYSADRKQFGKPVGSFQAVKHHMANVAVALEFAKAPVHRAAFDLAAGAAGRAQAVSHAKLVACEAANLAAKHSIQVHGAMGYTWEVDLHIYMKKAWALANSYGDAGFHKQRLGHWLLDADAPAIGAGTTFA